VKMAAMLRESNHKLQIRNPTLEIRSSKQIQMIKKHKIPNKPVSGFDFWISDLTVLVCFGPRGRFRASDFGF